MFAGSLDILMQIYLKKLKNTLSFKFPANIYLFKVNNRNTTKRCEICSKLTTFCGVSIVDFYLNENLLGDQNFFKNLYSGVFKMMFFKSSQNAWNIYVEDFNFSEVLVFE